MKFIRELLSALVLVGSLASVEVGGATAPRTAAPAQSKPLVVVDHAGGAYWCTLEAENVSLYRLLALLAEQLDSEVEGLDPNNQTALVTVQLENRSVDQALEYVLGSVGLRALRRPGVIEVHPAESPADGIDELVDRAMASYLRSTRQFPSHPLAASARISQGVIEQRRGNQSAALNHYQAVVEDFRGSAYAPEALWRSGLVLEEMRLWKEASESFHTLAGMASEHPYQGRLRVELARCAVQMGDPERAVYLLNSMRADHRPENDKQRAERLLVRARALNALDRHRDALLSLDQVLGLGTSRAQSREILELQAVALEGVGLLAQAGRAWLIYSAESEGDQKATGLERAARLALDSGDEVGALFVCKQAREDGFGAALAALEREARGRLGLDVEVDPDSGSTFELVDHADELLASGQVSRAARVLQPLAADLSRLDKKLVLRVMTGWARCLEVQRGIEEAVQALGEYRRGLADADSRRQLDLFTASMFERNELFDRAIEAYGGRY